jgi:hypothetical protein
LHLWNTGLTHTLPNGTQRTYAIGKVLGISAGTGGNAAGQGRSGTSGVPYESYDDDQVIAHAQWNPDWPSGILPVQLNLPVGQLPHALGTVGASGEDGVMGGGGSGGSGAGAGRNPGQGAFLQIYPFA